MPNSWLCPSAEASKSKTVHVHPPGVGPFYEGFVDRDQCFPPPFFRRLFRNWSPEITPSGLQSIQFLISPNPFVVSHWY